MKRDGTIKISWDKGTDCDGYIIFVKTESEWKKLVEIENIDLFSISVPDMQIGKEYCFRIQYSERISSGKMITMYEKYLYATVGKKGATLCYENPKPILLGANVESDGVVISWKRTSKYVLYRVFKREEHTKWNCIGDTYETFFIDENARDGKLYKYTVRCIDTEGKTYRSNFDSEGIQCRHIEV